MKKILSVLIVLVLCVTMFVACDKRDVSNSGITIGGNNTQPTPEPTPEPLFQEPLTGLEKSSSYPEDRAPVAVMVNNIKSSNGNDAFPQWGIGSADLIYEIVTEGGITRLMAVFADYENMPSVGPVRSARDQHVQLMLPMNALYVHEGASIFAKRMLGENGYDPEDFSMYPWMSKDLYNGNPLIGTRVVDWDKERRAYRSQEMCAYTNSEMVASAVGNGADDTGEPRPIFNFVSYKEPERTPQEGDAQSMYVQFSSSYYTGFDYNTETQTYYKTNTKGQPHIDGNTDEQLSFKNVLVLFSEIKPYSSMGYDAGQLMHVEYSFGGYGYYFTNGKYERVRWLKGVAHEPLRIVDMDGNEIDVQINPGKTYVGFSDYGMLDYCQINNESFNPELHKAPEIVENSADNVEAAD